MKPSLRDRALLLVTAINLAVFGVAGYVVSRQTTELSRTLIAETNRQLDFLRQEALRPVGEVNAARVLDWQGWELWSDSVLVVGRVHRQPGGAHAPLGLALNPIGAAHRDGSFDLQRIYGAIHEAIDSGGPVAAQGGMAVPVDGIDGTWGGVWYATWQGPGLRDVAGELLPWFLGTTLLVTLLSFWALRKLVLEPVEHLAEGSRRVRGGDLSVRLPEPRRTDEIADLVRAFNEMTATVQGAEVHLREEVERATRQAHEAEAAAMTQRRLAAMGELAAGIAHEINNPLGGLQNAAQALGREGLSPSRRERYLALLQDGLSRIRETVQRLLRFTPRPAAESRVNLGEVTLDAMDLVRHRARGDGVEISIALPGRGKLLLAELSGDLDRAALVADVPPVVGGRSELGQAVLNLLQNALDALEEARSPGARVDVTLSADAHDVVLSVRDNGPGVSGERMDRLADLFYTTKDVGRGTGLGLAIVHNVIDSHRGRLRLSNVPEGGFLAEVTLPRAGEEG